MYDLVVIGSGPGGYIAAIKAAQLDMKVACVEKYSTFGGTCLNVGCIPSKALLESSEKYHEAKETFSNVGINIDSVELDLEKMLGHKSETVESLTKGVEFLFDKYGVEGINGFGSIVDANTVQVEGEDGETQELETDKILIATGSKPATLPGIEFDDDRIVDSTWALEFDEVPEHLVVIGAGVIGLEMGSIWKRLGADVTVIEFLPELLGGRMDKDLVREATKTFEKQGLEFIFNAKVTAAEVDGDEVEVTYEMRDEDGETKTITGDRLLVSVGRRAYTDGLGLENIGLETNDRGQIEVDDDFQTSVDGVYALGDVIPGPMLAHKAEEEGVVCVERMNGIGAHINYDAIPEVTYTDPEIAVVGKTEKELEEAGIDYEKGKFNFRANGRARALDKTDGFCKILADSRTDKILGAAIIGPRAGDLIAELAVASEFHASSEDVARSSHAHPTLAEIVKEAALSVTGDPLNS
ncbi:MAG: dihydrolipoyl dehydrogenase [Myxococcota bacterium]